MAARSPTLDTLALMGAVFLAQVASAAAGDAITPLLVLSPPLDQPVWAPITSVYAHGSPSHLVGNAVALAILGVIVERGTTRLRFHLFFVTTGALSIVAEAAVQQALGNTVAVLGASGAVFALLGYVLSGNAVSGRVLGWLDLSAGAQLVVAVVVAAAVALYATPEGAALIGHFTGLALGLVAGRLGVLRAE